MIHIIIFSTSIGIIMHPNQMKTRDVNCMTISL